MKSATVIKSLLGVLLLGLGACSTTQEHRVIGANTTCRWRRAP